MFEPLYISASRVLVELSQKRFAERDREFDKLLGNTPKHWEKSGRYEIHSARKTVAVGRSGIGSNVFRS